MTTTSPVTTSTIPPVTTTTVPLVTTTTLPPSSTFTLYLHNSPSPPAGSTNSQPVLPMDPAVPGGGTLHNYDTDRDGAAGLLLAKSSAGIAEGDPTKYQIWSYATSSDTYVGQVTMTFWSSMIDFQVTERGRLQMRLMDCDAAGSSCINLATKNVRIDPWNGGVADWVSHTISFARVDHTIPGGRTLRLKVVVGSSSGNDMWFAYDTSSYRSRLLIEP